MPEKALSKRLKLSLDELRMQTLGTQVLLGFQLQSLFQPGFVHAGMEEKVADGISLAAILIAFTMLIVPPSQHRIVAAWEATRSLLRTSDRCAEAALLAMAVGLSAIAISLSEHRGSTHSELIGLSVGAFALLTWFGIGAAMKRPARVQLPERETVDLHTKIDQMLTEARVILPGVQAMLGFQLIVLMTDAFERLPVLYRDLHLVGLTLTGVSMALLLAPAAIHRLAFDGEDDGRFHAIGSRLVTAALTPLATAMALEISVGTWKLTGDEPASIWAGACTLCMMLGAWYAVPLAMRKRAHARSPDVSN